MKELKQATAYYCEDGDWDYCEYFNGFANEMINSLAIINRKEPEFLQPPEKYITDNQDVYNFNITLKQLKKAVKFAKKYGCQENKAIELIVDSSSGIGNILTVRALDDGFEKHITDCECW